jgi:hypothetical protein
MRVEQVVGIHVLAWGYRKAHERFKDATQLVDAPVEFTFPPLFEALNWAVTLGDRLGRPSHPYLAGIRFARNRVHHNWANALYYVRDPDIPVSPGLVRFGPFEWRWRPAHELPVGESTVGESDYRQLLEHRNAAEALDEVASFFERETGTSSGTNI